MRCIKCGSIIEEGLKGRPPIAAKYCLKCRAERRLQRNGKYEWVPKHHAYLREHYHGGLLQRGRVIRALARVTGFPRWYIKRQAQRLGLTMHTNQRSWTPDDLVILERLLGKVSAVTIAKKLKRTEARRNENQGLGELSARLRGIHHA